MRLKIASRKSDLARWQAELVARAIQAKHPEIQIEHIYKSSFGDDNLDLSLQALGGKGVFTEDFLADLSEGRCDMVVHSWKDLPVEARASTHIAMTLPRADLRDILFVPEEVWAEAQKSKRLKILTSSPRRVYNLSTELPGLLPGNPEIEFVPVRGNVPTRLKRMRDQGAGLVLAKAGLDRLMDADFSAIENLIKDCRFQILPLSLNPPAPAQGALAIEILNSNHELSALCSLLNHSPTAQAANLEREVLKSYGGGCHQKIGVAVVEKDYGRLFSLRGETEAGEILKAWKIESSTPWSKARLENEIFPVWPRENRWFDREARTVADSELRDLPGLIVARAEAWPKNFSPTPMQRIWTAGVMTWRRLALAGIWVHGTFDGLGENEPMGLKHLGAPPVWTKLTHQGAAKGHDVATYSLRARADAPDLNGRTHFFWMSSTSFEEALKRFPDVIRRGMHSCGPGQTYSQLKNRPEIKNPLKVFVNWEQFKSETLP